MDEGSAPRSKLGAMKEYVTGFATRLTRTKVIDLSVLDTNLRRCLSTADITLLGIGHMVGSGVYVLTATVAKEKAGPAIVIAFLLSGLASFLAALCYAELGVRYPKSGSAYSYTYLALGELWAFLVGWNVVLENVIGVAAVAKSCSQYIDALSNGIIKNATDYAIPPIHVQPFSTSLDFLAVVIVILFVIFLSFGVKMTSQLNNVFSVVNLTVIAIIIGVGAYFSDIKNWTNPETGGFLPYGWSGVFAASATCFYAYIGFDSVATSGEEARDPQKSIPRATMMSMATATVAYVGVSTVLTLMVNYQQIDSHAGLPNALGLHGAHWAKIIVIIGAVCGMATSLIGSLFALTRIVYAMADDGLLFKIFSYVNDKTKIPLGAMYFFATLSAVMSFTLEIDTLVDLMSIGTIFAYLVVSSSVIILRYQPVEKLPSDSGQELSSMVSSTTTLADDKALDPVCDRSGTFRDQFRIYIPLPELKPGKLVSICVLVMTVMMLSLCFFVKYESKAISRATPWTIFLILLFCLGIVLPFIVILMHYQSTVPLRYKVPLVPLIPAISVFINALLITSLSYVTWLRLLVWVTIGLFLYFLYGLRHSKLETSTSQSPSTLLLSPGSLPPQNWGATEKELGQPNGLENGQKTVSSSAIECKQLDEPKSMPTTNAFQYDDVKTPAKKIESN